MTQINRNQNQATYIENYKLIQLVPCQVTELVEYVVASCVSTIQKENTNGKYTK